MEYQEGQAVAGLVHVTSVAVSSDPGDDDTYWIGDIIETRVQFDDEVTATGSPQLKLDIGGEDKTAAFESALSSSDGDSRSGSA